MSRRPPPLRRRYAILGLTAVCTAFLVLTGTLIAAPRSRLSAVLAILAACWLLGVSILFLLHDFARTHAHIAAQAEAIDRALIDAVTGLAVRQVAEDFIASSSPACTLTVAMVDVDQLHDFNNAYGHPAGDVYLHAIAERLARAAGEDGMAARLGGDEFAVVSPRTPAYVVAALAAALAAPVDVAGKPRPIQVSIGICHLPGADPHLLFGCADLAMFTARRTGSGIECYDPARDGTPRPVGIRPGWRPRDRRPLPAIQSGPWPLPLGLLACPKCGATGLATIEQISGPCYGEITRDSDGDVEIEGGGHTDVDWDRQVSIGVQCEQCPWAYRGDDWQSQLTSAPNAEDDAEDGER